jgi:hypothetical protein
VATAPRLSWLRRHPPQILSIEAQPFAFVVEAMMPLPGVRVDPPAKHSEADGQATPFKI